MKKNKYFIYLLLLLPALMLGSCTPEQDDYFDEPSSTRLANLMSSTRKALMGSEQGWVFEVFPGLDGQEFGGCVYTAKFDSLTVSVRSELAGDPTYEETSYYKMTNEAGAAVIFDTGNQLIHYLSEGTSSNYKALGGDIEFVIDSVGADIIKVHGARSGNTCYFRRLTMPAEDYIAAVGAIQADFIYGNYYGTIGGKAVAAEFNLNSNQIYINPDTTQTVEEVSTSFIYTNTGIRFYEPITINGITVSELAFDYDAGTLTGTDGSGNTFVLTGILPEGYRMFADYEGTYRLLYNKGSRSMTVTLTPDETGSRYYMTNFFPNSPTTPITLTYSKATGALYMNSQQVATEGGNQVWLCGWALAAGGNLTWDESAGMMTKWNGDEANPVYTWVDNAQSSYIIDSFIVWTLNSAGSSAGQYAGTLYRIRTGSSQMPYVTTMTKQ
ncbi:DUF4302 domain-containing protein [Prevotella sp. KH2C16]|uniref:DUF4302 domain-containing protein n=1 Tax=Prevotella sp. KH2C16 TaxID=1855325 RepID=UPI0008EFC24B|nr:DUF4302 domain-containing protein [Prevotella sp. KH2C16]SFG04135.1 protein of unknown function [Prevotella sp. KH2C16]